MKHISELGPAHHKPELSMPTRRRSYIPSIRVMADKCHDYTWLMLMVCSLCMATKQVLASAPDATKSAASSTAQPAKRPVKLSGEELSARLLKFISGLRKRSDINAGNFQRVMDMRLVPDPDLPGAVRHIAYADAGWQYWFQVSPQPGGVHGVRFGTYIAPAPTSHGSRPCTIDLDAFARQIKRQGYRALEIRAHALPANLMDFSKPPFAVHASSYTSADGRRCITTMAIEYGVIPNG